MLQAGTAKVEITPPAGVRMGGYAGRAMPSLAVHDPLWARALVLDDGDHRAALVSLDLLFAADDVVKQVRETAASAAGVSPEGLLIAGTHTHSAIRGADDDCTDQEREYWEAVPDKIAEALARAAEQLHRALLAAGSGWSAVGINRREMLPGGRVELGRNHFGPFDPEVGVVRIQRLDGTPIAGLLNYTCHGICLQSDNYLLSADYPGYAVHYLEQAVGDGVMGMFFNGACGDVNPREAGVSHGLAGSGGFFLAERAGTVIAGEAARVWESLSPQDVTSVYFGVREIALPTKRQRAIKAAEDALQRAQAAARSQEQWSPYVSWYDPPDAERERKRLERLKAEGDAPVRCEIQAIKIGPVAFIGWPGEIFSQLGMQIKARSPIQPTYVIGYANGSIGYVPTPEAFPQGGYEVDCALHLAEEAGPVLVEESASLLQALA
jgi:hypothetical protein